MKKPLWSPTTSQIESTQLWKFQESIAKQYNISLPSYHDFWKWSVDNLEEFWKNWAKESRLLFQKEPSSILKTGSQFSKARWFPDSEINFAENLLRKMKESPEKIAIHFQPEKDTVPPRYLTRSSLLKEVAKLAKFFRDSGIKKGDRIAGVLPNSPESLIAMLATTSLGAVWSSASPDFGVKGILDRFGQIEPKILVLSNGYFFKGKEINCLPKWNNVLSSLPSVEKCLLWNFTQPSKILDLSELSDSTNQSSKKDLVQLWDELDPVSSSTIIYEPIQFSDPVYIMYSSGTTGLPKCIVQGAGVLLNHTKELILHTDLRESESITYYTTCGWMMWNWVASSLYIGSQLSIFDGNPFYPDWRFLWEWIDREKISVFGTSAKYLTVLQSEGAEPGKEYALENLRAILSTGSPLPESGFTYVYEKVKKDLQLSSISGGTDLNGCFGLGSPSLPVYSGELQCRGLGMAVEIYNDDGMPVIEEKGELVCTKPFPSMPLKFWDDKNGEKYEDAYFSSYPGIWCHGDFAKITENNGLIIYGRSDATLNPGGVRIGTADIYTILETFPEIDDSVIIGQDYDNDVRVVLFAKMKHPYSLDEELTARIKKKIKEECSPRHVPSIILAVEDIPYTVNGKKVELAIKNIVEGKPVKNANALGNPDCLEEYSELSQKFLQ
jgi:acetoacetyl-CoA synthetase